MGIVLKFFTKIPVLLGMLPLLFGKLKSFVPKKHGKEILIVLVGGITVYYLWKASQHAKTVSELSQMDDANKKAYKSALLLADMLGTSKGISWYNPSSWSEDDYGAYKLLKENKTKIDLMSVHYKDATGRGMLADLTKHLDSRYLKEVLSYV